MERWTPVYQHEFDRHNDLNGGEPFCRTMAWAWIRNEAQFEAGVRRIQGQPIRLQRGELPGSYRWFAEQWGWGVKKVRNFVEYLMEVGKLDKVKVTAAGTVYRVVNYGSYRPSGHSEGHTKGHGRGTVGAQGIEGNTSYSLQREAGDDVEKSAPPASDDPTRLEELGVDQEAIRRVRSLEGFDDIAERGLVRAFRPDGIRGERIWKGVDPERIPGLISAAIDVYIEEADDRSWNRRYFGFKLEGQIEDELRPTPADQAKARTAKSPAGRLSAEEEHSREANRRAAARVRQGQRQMQEAKDERERTLEQVQRIDAWLAQHPEQEASIETAVRKRITEELGFASALPSMVRAYVLKEAEKRMQEMGRRPRSLSRATG